MTFRTWLKRRSDHELILIYDTFQAALADRILMDKHTIDGMVIYRTEVWLEQRERRLAHDDPQ